MRRQHEPFFLLRLYSFCRNLYAKHFIFPQFEQIGQDNEFMSPANYQFVGKGFYLGNHNRFMALNDANVRLSIWPSEDNHARIVIGDYCIINPGVRITAASEIIISDYCMLAMGVYLMDMDGHDLQHRVFAPGQSKAIRLKKNVWVGDGALICKGVTIGENSIVAARSVVTKDVPKNVVVAGNPAKVVKNLDESEGFLTRKDLFDLGWVPPTYEVDQMKAQAKGNNLLKWFRSKIWPTIND